MAAGDLVTMPFHVEWRGLLLGWPLSSCTLSGLSGWRDLPATRSGDVNRPNRHGSFAGPLRAGSRVIEASFRATLADPELLPAIEAVTVLDEDPVEEPLVIWAGTQAELVFARVHRRAIPTDHAWSVGDERATIQWVATDARRYSVAEQRVPVGLPSPPSGGLAFPLVFPLDFGAGQSGGMVTVTNSGNAATWPVWEVQGPVTGPIIRHVGTGRQLLIDPSYTVPAGQTMVLDTMEGTVEVAGISRRERLFDDDWFPLLPGANEIQFTSVGAYDPAALLTCVSRHASM